jgi:hypothetical protein
MLQGGGWGGGTATAAYGWPDGWAMMSSRGQASETQHSVDHGSKARPCVNKQKKSPPKKCHPNFYKICITSEHMAETPFTLA